ncbi:unnamed protein product [Ranitomeya imitator]|uniref:Uncharacterized protein n=1 Tax=Ranitomeya imitator TaxID=111125 RepID=A0ABN9LXD6_9NEOB|nr:unnamed protein product [Ranitomeya imitator]
MPLCSQEPSSSHISSSSSPAAFPVFFLETALGQYTNQGGFTAWRKICPLFEGYIGFASQVIESYPNSIILLSSPGHSFISSAHLQLSYLGLTATTPGTQPTALMILHILRIIQHPKCYIPGCGILENRALGLSDGIENLEPSDGNLHCVFYWPGLFATSVSGKGQIH